MKLLVLYKPKSEHARTVEEYTNDFSRLHHRYTIELMDAESVEGVQTAQLYDIWDFPALLAMASDDSLLHSWSGALLPTMDEIVSYLIR